MLQMRVAPKTTRIHSTSGRSSRYRRDLRLAGGGDRQEPGRYAALLISFHSPFFAVHIPGCQPPKVAWNSPFGTFVRVTGLEIEERVQADCESAPARGVRNIGRYWRQSRIRQKRFRSEGIASRTASIRYGTAVPKSFAIIRDYRCMAFRPPSGTLPLMS